MVNEMLLSIREVYRAIKDKQVLLEIDRNNFIIKIPCPKSEAVKLKEEIERGLYIW